MRKIIRPNRRQVLSGIAGIIAFLHAVAASDTMVRIGSDGRVRTMKNAILLLLLVPTIVHAEAVFIDNHPGVINGSTVYDPGTRTCGRGGYKVFAGLDQAAQALSQADTLYLRAGVYGRDSVGDYHVVHGNKVNYWTGSLAITADGSPQKRKRVSAYQDELVIVQARSGVNHYNPNPADTEFADSSHYYAHPAISISGAYVDVVGLKTYGQVVINGHDIILEGCDLGGGGPHMNQGQVVALNGTGGKIGGVYNVVIRNNRIHHSCWGESAGNGAALMCYNASFVVENNEFHDNYGPDIAVKDTGGQQGRDIIIRYNFFGPSSIRSPGNAGVLGHNQDAQVDHIYIHNNIFYAKTTGVSFRTPAQKGTVAYNNTFVNCGYGPGETGDIGDWQNPQIRAHNNLHYHDRPGRTYYSIQTAPWSKLDSDHNLFFSTTGETQWKHVYRRRATTLAQWRQYSGRDLHSVWKDPQFVNPSGSRPDDFKRITDPPRAQDVVGSDYGPVCGAYVTGREIIGLLLQE